MLALRILGLLAIFLVSNNNAESWTCGVLYLFTCSNNECIASARESVRDIAGLNFTAHQELIEFSCADDYKLVGPAYVMCDTRGRKLMSYVFPTCQPLLTEYTGNNTESNTGISSSDSYKNTTKERIKSKAHRYKYKYKINSYCDVTIHNYVIIGLLIVTAILVIIVIVLIVCFAKSRKHSKKVNDEKKLAAPLNEPPPIPPRFENPIYLSILEHENSESVYTEPRFTHELGEQPVVENLYEEYISNRIQFDYEPVESHL